MYKVKIKGAFRGNFKTLEEAMAYVEKWARKFKHPWVILDKFNKIHSQG